MAERSPVERLIAERTDETAAPELTRTSMQRQRTIEGYLASSAPPRWMERLAQVDHGIARERRRLAEAYEELRAACGGDAERFAARWRAAARAWAFDDGLNVLIEQHNDWYPIERNLAMDPRTRDYVLVNGRSYRRPMLDAEWVLREFPPR